MNWGGIDYTIVGPALAAGLLVTATHVPLGAQVLARGIVFIDLAIAQIAGLGVVLADAAGVEAHGWTVQLYAVSAALAGALLLTWTEKRWPEVQEAIIGTVFVLAASAALLLLAANPHGGEHLRELLVGQILWVTPGILAYVALIYVPLLAVWLWSADRMGRVGFYVVFASVVTISVQLVGLYLVFTTLIVPALATRGMARGRMTAAFAIGAAGYALGLAVSAVTDWPSGPAVVWAMALAALVALALRRGARGPVAAQSSVD